MSARGPVSRARPQYKKTRLSAFASVVHRIPLQRPPHLAGVDARLFDPDATTLRRWPVSRSTARTQWWSVSGEQPIFSAIDRMVAPGESCSRSAQHHPNCPLPYLRCVRSSHGLHPLKEWSLQETRDGSLRSPPKFAHYPTDEPQRHVAKGVTIEHATLNAPEDAEPSPSRSYLPCCVRLGHAEAQTAASFDELPLVLLGDRVTRDRQQRPKHEGPRMIELSRPRFPWTRVSARHDLHKARRGSHIVDSPTAARRRCRNGCPSALASQCPGGLPLTTLAA